MFTLEGGRLTLCRKITELPRRYNAPSEFRVKPASLVMCVCSTCHGERGVHPDWALSGVHHGGELETTVLSMGVQHEDGQKGSPSGDKSRDQGARRQRTAAAEH